MAQINEISFSKDENTAWMNTCNDSIDYFPNVAGSLKYIIEQIKECGADKIKIKHEGDDSYVPRRVKQICKLCGYKYIETSYLKEYKSGIINDFGSFDTILGPVYEFELIKL